jgi:hypothetical protein
MEINKAEQTVEMVQMVRFQRVGGGKESGESRQETVENRAEWVLLRFEAKFVVAKGEERTFFAERDLRLV